MMTALNMTGFIMRVLPADDFDHDHKGVVFHQNSATPENILPYWVDWYE
jgi:hypothetical protein